MTTLPTTISLTARDPVKPKADARASIAVAGAVPMSMPAVLGSSRAKYAHLHGGKVESEAVRRKEKKDRGGDLTAGGSGKRRRRRYENAQLAGNPHVHRPSRADYAPGPRPVESTLFAPPPPSFPRSVYVPAASGSMPMPSAAGQFSLSLRGVRRTLRGMTRPSRGAGGRTEEMLSIMEDELRRWLLKSGAIAPEYYHSSSTGRVIDPTPVENFFHIEDDDATLPDLPRSRTSTSAPTPSTPRPPLPSLTELSRSPSSLVWLLPSAHARYLLHLLARFYALQSFSRPLSPLDPTTRVTHILRPQMVRPAAPAALGLDTPPGTDMSDIGGGARGGETTTAGETTASENEVENGVLVSTEGSESGNGTGDDDYSSSSGDDSDLDDDRPARRTLLVGEEVVLIEGGRAVPSDYSGDVDLGGTSSEDLDDEDYDGSMNGDGGVDSLASSFADLRPSSAGGAEATPVVARTRVLANGSPNAGATTPRPLRSRLPRASFPPLRRAPSVDSSASEGPVQYEDEEASQDRAWRTLGLGAGSGWEMPERTLLDYIFE